MSKSLFALGLIPALFLSQSSLAYAEGLRLYGMSAQAQARGEAIVASVDNSAAAWYNPAALTRLNGTDISLNLNNLWVFSEYTNLSNQTEKNARDYFPLFGLYAGSKLGTENLAVGLAINTPFGLATEYSKTSPFRYITTGGEIVLVNISPVVAYRLHPSFSIGGGLNYYYSTAELRQQYPWTVVVPGSPDGSVRVRGRGDGFGFNIGLLHQPGEKHSLALTYKSQVVIKYSGQQAEFTDIPAGLGLGGSYSTGVKTTLQFPDIVAWGYAYKPTSQWTWEIGGQWTNWRDFKSVDIHLDQPTALFANSSTSLSWKNSWVLRTGIAYDWSKAWTFSGGYFFDKSPTRESTYSPLIPDGDHHVFSIGARYKTGNFTFETPLVGILQTGTSSINSATSDILGNQVDGNYKLHAIQFGIGLTYAFSS